MALSRKVFARWCEKKNEYHEVELLHITFSLQLSMIDLTKNTNRILKSLTNIEMIESQKD